MPNLEIDWPAFTAAYVDEFGPIHPDVYEAGSRLWPRAERFALVTLRDAYSGFRLMLKAVARVSEHRAKNPDEEIRDLKGYLFTTFKRLVLSEREKVAGHREVSAQLERESSLSVPDLVKNLERKILIEELVQHMDPQTRNVFEALVLGYSFEEIAARTNVKANLLRSRFHKRIRRLAKSIRQEIEAAGFSVAV